MESRHRRHFIAVAETGTMARAAEHVFLTQSRLHVAELTAIEIEARVADGALDMGVAFYPTASDAVMGEHRFDDVLVLAMAARSNRPWVRRDRSGEASSIRHSTI